VRAINFEVQPREIFGLIGPDGAGNPRRRHGSHVGHCQHLRQPRP
jgi:ABC-type lipopolysaccharide export system ATPase subunit